MIDVAANASTISGTHPYADKFPMLPDSELAELAESIKANGLRNAIVITPDGLVLDGRNRAAACELAGVDPTTVVYTGDDLAEYVIDCNSSRRHMSTGARAIAQAGLILDHAPDIAAAVVAGDVALDAAYRQAVDARDAERRMLEEQERLAAEEVEAERFIRENAPELADQVGGPFESFVEAQDVWNRRNREEAARRKSDAASKALRVPAPFRQGDIARPEQNLVAQLRAEAAESIGGTRRNRKASIRRDMEYLLDALAGETILGTADPVFAQAIPLGNGRDKTLGLWTDSDWQRAVNTRNRNVVEAGRAAAEFADLADQISDHIRRRGVLHTVDLFGGSYSAE